jgi:hypothetical protein
MRLAVSGVLVLMSSVTYGQDGQRMFELPMAQKPPQSVRMTIDDALRKLGNATDKVFEETETRLQKDLLRFQEDKKLADANLTQAVLEFHKYWLIRRTLEDKTPSPIGRWYWPPGPDPKKAIIDLKADGTATAAWHKSPCLWTQDTFGRVRMIITSTRAITELDLTDRDTMKLVTSLGDQASPGAVMKRAK